MLKSIGLKKINISIFISGNGSNLKSLINQSVKKNSKFKIALVISNNPKAKGLDYTKRFKIKKKIINYSNIKDAEKKILTDLKKNNIDLICLAGFMKILSKNFIKSFNKGRPSTVGLLYSNKNGYVLARTAHLSRNAPSVSELSELLKDISNSPYYTKGQSD